MINVYKKIMIVSGIDIQVVKKDIKNLHIAVYPPDGQVRVTIPSHVTEENVRLAILSKLGWIKQKQKDFSNQPRQSEKKYLTGEYHYFQGKRYYLELLNSDGKPEIRTFKSGKIKMFVRRDAKIETKEKLLNNWYRNELKQLIPGLLKKWQPIVGKEAAFCGVRKMKTKWGSCNTTKAHIWINLELAKKPIECLEYIIVHELTHLHERHHNIRFKRLLEDFMPEWRSIRNILDKSPLTHYSS